MQNKLFKFLIFGAAISLTQCKVRRDSSLMDFESVPNENGFYLRVSTMMDERVNTDPKFKERCYDKTSSVKYTDYIDPYNGKVVGTFNYTSCMNVKVEKINKTPTGQEVVYATAKLSGFRVRQLAESIYCRKERENYTKNRDEKLGQDALQLSKQLTNCLDVKNKSRINAAIGYLLQSALPRATTIAKLANYSAVLEVKPLVLEKAYLLNHSFDEVESHVTSKLGRGHPDFRVPVLAMLSGMATQAMYEMINDDEPDWVHKAKDEVALIQARKFAEKNQLVTAHPTPTEMRDYGDRCYSKVDVGGKPDVCVGYPCSPTEFKALRRAKYEDYSYCRPRASDLLRVVGGIMAITVGLPSTIGADQQTKDEMYDLTMKILDDGKSHLFFDTESFFELDRYLKLYGLHGRYGQ